jgi:hypothetical protein
MLVSVDQRRSELGVEGGADVGEPLLEGVEAFADVKADGEVAQVLGEHHLFDQAEVLLDGVKVVGVLGALAAEPAVDPSVYRFASARR